MGRAPDGVAQHVTRCLSQQAAPAIRASGAPAPSLRPRGHPSRPASPPLACGRRSRARPRRGRSAARRSRRFAAEAFSGATPFMRAKLTTAKRRSPISASSRSASPPSPEASRTSSSSSSTLAHAPAASGKSKPTAAAFSCTRSARSSAGSASGTPASAPCGSSSPEASRSARLMASQFLQHLAAPAHRQRPEDMRVAAHELLHLGLHHVADRERALRLGDVGVEEDVEEQVAQFLLDRLRVLFVDGLHDLERLLDGQLLDRVVRLLAVPRALAAQAAHDGHEVGVEVGVRRVAVGVGEFQGLAIDRDGRQHAKREAGSGKREAGSGKCSPLAARTSEEPAPLAPEAFGARGGSGAVTRGCHRTSIIFCRERLDVAPGCV